MVACQEAMARLSLKRQTVGTGMEAGVSLKGNHQSCTKEEERRGG